MENAGRGGASGARNTGVAVATGDVVAFLDDDARPEPDWLERLMAAYDDPAVMAVGGVARPVWPDRRPDHLPPELDWLVGCTYLGQPTERADVRNLWGCNMSVRRFLFEEIGGFDEDAGRVGLIPLGAEETEFCIRIAQRRPGSRVVFEPAAVVHHRVTPARTEFSYLRSRSHAEGVSKAAMATAGRRPRRDVRGEPLRQQGPDRRAAPGARPGDPGRPGRLEGRRGHRHLPRHDRLLVRPRAAGPPGQGQRRRARAPRLGIVTAA